MIVTPSRVVVCQEYQPRRKPKRIEDPGLTFPHLPPPQPPLPAPDCLSQGHHGNRPRARGIQRSIPRGPDHEGARCIAPCSCRDRVDRCGQDCRKCPSPSKCATKENRGARSTRLASRATRTWTPPSEDCVRGNCATARGAGAASNGSGAGRRTGFAQSGGLPLRITHPSVFGRCPEGYACPRCGHRRLETGQRGSG